MPKVMRFLSRAGDGKGNTQQGSLISVSTLDFVGLMIPDWKCNYVVAFPVFCIRKIVHIVLV
jgi:hypothetical protein